VEGSTVHPLAVAAYQSLGSRQHLLGCPARERKQQDALGLYSALDQMRHPIDERPCLSGSGAGDDEQRTVAVGCSGRLLRIQLRGEIPRRSRRIASWTRRIDFEGVGHPTP
jgi:hypothetical protein